MKIKHLLAGIFVLLSCSIVYVYGLHPILQEKMISQEIASGNVEEAKLQLQKQIEKERFNTLDLIKDYIIEREPWSNRYDVYIGPSMSHWASTTGERIFTLEESEPYLQKYLNEAPANGFLRRVVEILVSYYESLNDYENAISVIEKGLERFSASTLDYHELELLRIEIAINNGQYDDAETYIEGFEESASEVFRDIPLLLARLKAELFVQKGALEEAVALLSEAINDWNESKKEDEHFEMVEYPSLQSAVTYLEQLERFQNEADDFGVVTGKVIRSTGVPVHNVGVFLREEHTVNRSVSEHERYQTVTKADGSFSFSGVIPGSYQIHVGFMFDQIDGWSWPVDMYDWLDVKAAETIEYEVELSPLITIFEPANYEVVRDQEITFAWEPTQGAASYTLFGEIQIEGGSLSSPIRSGITEAEITVSVEQLYNVITGISFSGDEWTSVKPETILGFAYSDGLFSWSVKAFNDEGKPIGQSNGYRLREETMGSLPFFHLKARELSAADNVILSGKVEEAFEMYKENVEGNPDDVHSLRMVTRLIGLSGDTEQEALPYWKMLADKSPSAGNVMQVAGIYFRQENWAEFSSWYERALSYNEDVSADKSYMAKALMKQGQLEEAREVFIEILAEDRSNSFVGLLLALEIYLENDWATTVELAERYKERRSYQPRDWLTALQTIEQEVPIKVVKEALGNFFVGEEIEGHDLQIYPALAKFLNMLERVN